MGAHPEPLSSLPPVPGHSAETPYPSTTRQPHDLFHPPPNLAGEALVLDYVKRHLAGHVKAGTITKAEYDKIKEK